MNEFSKQQYFAWFTRLLPQIFVFILTVLDNLKSGQRDLKRIFGFIAVLIVNCDTITFDCMSRKDVTAYS